MIDRTAGLAGQRHRIPGKGGEVDLPPLGLLRGDGFGKAFGAGAAIPGRAGNRGAGGLDHHLHDGGLAAAGLAGRVKPRGVQPVLRHQPCGVIVFGKFDDDKVPSAGTGVGAEDSAA